MVDIGSFWRTTQVYSKLHRYTIFRFHVLYASSSFPLIKIRDIHATRKNLAELLCLIYAEDVVMGVVTSILSNGLHATLGSFVVDAASLAVKGFHYKTLASHGVPRPLLAGNERGESCRLSLGCVVL